MNLLAHHGVAHSQSLEQIFAFGVIAALVMAVAWFMEGRREG